MRGPAAVQALAHALLLSATHTPHIHVAAIVCSLIEQSTIQCIQKHDDQYAKNKLHKNKAMQVIANGVQASVVLPLPPSVFCLRCWVAAKHKQLMPSCAI